MYASTIVPEAMNQGEAADTVQSFAAVAADPTSGAAAVAAVDDEDMETVYAAAASAGEVATTGEAIEDAMP